MALRKQILDRTHREHQGNVRQHQESTGPTLNKTAPLRSSTREVITDKGHQSERWVKHYSIYSRENIVSPSALDAVECLPTMEELDTEPTMEELSTAIDSLASGKAPGSDDPPPPPPPPPPTDLLRRCKTTLLHSLHVLLCQCWQEGCTTSYAGRQDHQTLQDQLREE